MTFLYLVRHGEALHPAVDPARGLNEQGFHQVQQLANHLLEKNISPAYIFFSGKKRSQQTAEMIAKILKQEEKLRLLPVLDPDMPYHDLFEFLKDLEEDALVIGHLPNLEIIVNAFLPFSKMHSDFHYSTASIISLEKKDDAIQLAWFFEPNKP